MHDAATPAPIADPASLGVLASNLKTVWDAPTTDARLKNALYAPSFMRSWPDIDDAASEIVLIVHCGWRPQPVALAKRRRGQPQQNFRRYYPSRASLVLIASDDLIAAPNRNGLRRATATLDPRARHINALELTTESQCSKRPDDGIETLAQPRATRQSS